VIMSHIKHESTRENINRWKINNLWQSCNFVASAQCSLYIIRSSAGLINGYYQETGCGYYASSIAVSVLLIMVHETCL